MKLHELQANFVDARRTAQEEIKRILHERQWNWSSVLDYLWDVYEVRGLNKLSAKQMLETLAWLRDKPTMREKSTLHIMEQLRAQVPRKPRKIKRRIWEMYDRAMETVK